MTDGLQIPCRPRRIVLSRKGFDSGSGGCASPILPDGRPLSLPIPDFRSPTRYGDLRVGAVAVGDLVEDLTRGRVSPRVPCHLDPDLDPAVLPRRAGWHAALGQTGAAQSHLASRGVGAGDLFLFFGWFREVEEAEKDGRKLWRFRRGAPDLHILFGWLLVEQVLTVGGDTERALSVLPWLEAHPHLHRRSDAANTLYIAADRMTLGGRDLPGAGCFSAVRPELVLSAPERRGRSLWRVPAWMHPDTGRTLTYHEDPARWAREKDGVLLRAAARGQEFVIETGGSPDVTTWLESLFCSLVP